MALQESGEMYLEIICILSLKGTFVRSIDVAEYMGFSKPSVSRGLGLLKQGGYLTADRDGYLHLTESGRQVAAKIYRRHTVIRDMLIHLGVDERTAAQDACRIEHVNSNEPLRAICLHAKQASPDTPET